MTDSNNSLMPELILPTETSNAPSINLTLTDEPTSIPTSTDLVKKEESQLSPQELAMVKEFAQKIDINNSAQVLQFGAASQQKMSQFSETALANVRAKDMDEIGTMLTGLVVELKGFSAEDDSKGLFGLFKKAGKKVTELKARYDTVEKNVDKIVNVLETHKVTLLKDIAMLDKLYERNLAYFKELTMYILAGGKNCRKFMTMSFPLRRPKPRIAA